MRRKRHQQGSLKVVRGRWIAQWWEEGHRRNKLLGKASKVTKSQAKDKLAEILAPINTKQRGPSEDWKFGDFVNQVYLPWYRRKWKSSTTACNVDRLEHHLTCEFADLTLKSFKPSELQDFLDRKSAAGFSFSTVDHLRWDLKQIFGMAVAEGYLQKNPAALLFTPNKTKRPAQRVMTWQEVRLLFSVLETRGLAVCMLATIAGMRPGEIFALKWRHVKTDNVEIEQRLYRGKIDTPKTHQSKRSAALSQGLQSVIARWKSQSGDPGPEAWAFPSETLKTPLAKDNCWRRWIAPKLKAIGLEWVNFQVMRRTHTSLMHELKVDPKIVADQLGHSLDVNLNVYTKTALGLRKEAVNTFESALRIM
jgi:integrase